MAILALKIAIYQTTRWSPFTQHIIQIKLQQNHHFTCSLVHNIQIKYKKFHKLTFNIFIKIQSIKKKPISTNIITEQPSNKKKKKVLL